MAAPQDIRRVDAEHLPSADAEISAAATAYLELHLTTAKQIDQVARARHYALSGCSSARMWAQRRGIAGRQAQMLSHLGVALRTCPEVEDDLRAGHYCVDAAAALGRLFAEGPDALAGIDWRQRASEVSLTRLLADVRARIEKFRQGVRRTVPVTLHVTVGTLDSFRRCQDLISEKRKQFVSRGKTLSALVDAYRTAHDPYWEADRDACFGRDEAVRVAPPRAEVVVPQTGSIASYGDRVDGHATQDVVREGSTGMSEQQVPEEEVALGPVSKRSVLPPAEGRPRSRHVPVAVDKLLWERAGGACEVPGCGFTGFLQRAHIRAYARGGGQVLDNLLLLCPRHHTLFDNGYLLFIGFGKDDRPVFTDPEGEPLQGAIADALAPPLEEPPWAAMVGDDESSTEGADRGSGASIDQAESTPDPGRCP